MTIDTTDNAPTTAPTNTAIETERLVLRGWRETDAAALKGPDASRIATGTDEVRDEVVLCLERCDWTKAS